MKRLFSLLLGVVTVFTISAASFEKDGIYYVTDDDNPGEVFVCAQNCKITNLWVLEALDGGLLYADNYYYQGDVVVPATVSFDGVDYRVTRIAPGAFSGSMNLLSVTLPPSVREVGDYAFFRCPKLHNVDIQGKIRYIRESTFNDCDALEELDLSNVTEYLGIVVPTNLKVLTLPADALVYIIRSFGGPVKYLLDCLDAPGIYHNFMISEDSELYVPEEALNRDGFGFSPWGALGPFIIKNLADYEAGVTPAVASTRAWTLAGNHLHACAESSVEVFDIQGRKIAEVAPNSIVILSAGYYVARSGAVSEKICVE
ncbi:MAG: leucine-rich repeat domain-containing protein [Bacteroidales bacterium]|nr:leucine-rich repeat domain-containing protein [Bacteroidales bacterium]